MSIDNVELATPKLQHDGHLSSTQHTNTQAATGVNNNQKWRSTIVFFSMDALGHIHPILSLVKELRRRQHRAIILTTRPLNGAQRLQAMGLELEYCTEQIKSSNSSTGGEQTSEDVMRAIMKPLIETFRRGEVEAYKSTYRLDGAVGKHLDDMIQNHHLIETKMRSLKPDLIVYDHVIGIPCATSVASRGWVRMYSGFPSALYSSINDNFSAGFGLKMEQMSKEWKQLELNTKRTIREKLRKFWQQQLDHPHDWPLELDLTPTSPQLNFYLGIQELGLEQLTQLKPLPDTWFRLEHTIDDDDDDHEDSEKSIVKKLPEEFLNLPGKLIYFSLGTLVTCDTDLINRLLAIMSKSPNKFIVSMGQMDRCIKLYANMWGEKFVDQKEVLKRVDLFITHGGHNSIIEAFYYGVPGLIVLPVFADQFDSAQRVEDCGFGYRLNPFNCTDEALLSSINSLLTNQELRRRMQEVSSRLRSIKYHQIAADKLEQIISC